MKSKKWTTNGFDTRGFELKKGVRSGPTYVSAEEGVESSELCLPSSKKGRADNCFSVLGESIVEAGEEEVLAEALITAYHSNYVGRS